MKVKQLFLLDLNQLFVLNWLFILFLQLSKDFSISWLLISSIDIRRLSELILSIIFNKSLCIYSFIQIRVNTLILSWTLILIVREIFNLIVSLHISSLEFLFFKWKIKIFAIISFFILILHLLVLNLLKGVRGLAECRSIVKLILI